ncbi:MAG: DnaD domain protein [Romboutsia timonensis]|uniref:DnaD domain protein n=1 Tax=Romboutsia timonensis TaxID=1776391 RepID=UPI003990DD41
MAVYRHIHIDYWQDGFVLDLTPEEKYFYIYLMTNSKTSQCGIYELPKRIIETETGYNRETVDKLLNRFIDYKKIVYCEETREVFLMNWIKHNKIVSPKVKKCVYEELKKIKSMDMVNLFFKQCEGYGYTLDKSEIKINMGMDRVSIPIPEVESNFEYGYGEKEKEKQKEEEPTYSVGRFKNLYEQNIGLINGIVAEWLFEISELIDYELFKRAIEIATDKGKCNKGYVAGIIKQWLDNNIRTYDDLKAYEIGVKNRREESGEYSQYKYANTNERENEEYTRKPTAEEVEEIRRSIDEMRRNRGQL